MDWFRDGTIRTDGKKRAETMGKRIQNLYVNPDTNDHKQVITSPQEKESEFEEQEAKR